MKKLVLLIMTLLVAFSAFGQMTTLWEKSAATSSMPDWFDTGNLTRGFAYGEIDGEDRLVVVSRNGGNNLYVLDAMNGDSLSRLDPTGISGGTYHISDAGISDDGEIFVCNLAINGNLKVYKWEHPDSSLTVALDFPWTSGRLGDKMSVYGSSADNSLEMFFADGSNARVIHFTTSDNGATFDADTIIVEDFGGSASAAITDGGALYHNSGGNLLKRYDGGTSSVVSGGILSTASNATEFIFTDADNNEYVAVFQYGGGNENARVLKVADGDLAEASTYKLTTTLGSNSNVGGTGDVAVQDNGDGTFTVYVLSTNNGLGAYKFEFPVPPVDPVNMASNWEVWGDTYSFFLSGGDAARGMGYNPVTKNIYIASRAGGAYVHVLDDTTGAAIDTLDMTGVADGFYGLTLMKADAADDGVIYACNLAGSPSYDYFKVYRWENEDAVPTVALQHQVTPRFGDVFEVYGSGTDTKIYASARGGTEIKVFGTTDGTNFAEVQSIPITAGAADGGISVVDETMLWVNAAWKDMTLIDTAGNALADMPFAESYYGSVLYMEAANGAKLLATNTNHSAGNRRKVEVYNITDPSNPELWASGEMGNIEESNGNVAGNLKYDLNPDGTITLYQMATNNAIASWTLEVPEVFDILDIADVKVDLNSDYIPDLLDSTVTIRGTVVSPNYVGGSSSYYIQDATGGINIFKYGTEVTLNKGDVVQVTGTVDQYNGLTEVAFASVDDVTVLSTGATIEPTVVTLADLGEAIEGDYVKVEGVKLVDPSSWPSAGSSASLDVTDGTTTVTFRIDSDTDIDGQTVPPWKFDLVGVVSQNDYSAPYDDYYQFMGTFYDDLTIYSPVLTELDENFEEWTELSEEWEFTNISLISDEYALEGTGKYLGLTTMNTPGMVKTPYIEDPKQLRYYLAEYSGGSDVWDMTVLLVDESDVVVDTLEEWGAPGDFNWHLSVVDIDTTGIFAVKFIGDPVTNGSFYLDQISVKPAPAEAELVPAAVDFGVVEINTSGVATVYLKNTAPEGSEDLLVDSLGLSDDKFTAIIDTNLVPAGDSAAITIIYTPTDESDDSAILSVWHGDDMHGMVGLEGSGKIFWPLRWREMASADWMGVTANAPRTMAYSERTNYLYFVAHPNGYGDYVKVFDAEDGTFVQDMNMMTPLPSAGYLKINAVAATDDGQVFTCNLSSGSTFNLFRNAGYGADMHLAYSGNGIPIRVGDALAASGKGTDTKVYVSGTSAPYIYVFNTEDGANYSLADSVAITAGAASRGIAPVQHGEYFFINGTGTAPMYIKADGTVLYTFDTGVVPSGTAINYFEVETESAVRRFVGITNGWSSGTKVVELLGTPGDDLCSSVDVINAPTDSYNTNPNGNATGMAVYSPHNNTLIELITNNGVSAYSFEMIEDEVIAPPTDSIFAAINEDFEAWSELSPYWEFSNIRLADDSYSHSGTKYLGLATTNSAGKVVTPLVRDPKTLNFYLSEHTGGSDVWDLDVLLLNEFNEIVDTLLELSAPGDFDWHQHYADINLTGVYRVVFMGEVTSGSFYIDDVTIDDPVGIADAIPAEFQLHQNYPNPFNPTTMIRFDMPEDAKVHLAIFDITGRKVKTLINANVSAGYNQVVWDGTDHNGNPVSTGMYIYKLQAGDMIDVKKMTFLK